MRPETVAIGMLLTLGGLAQAGTWPLARGNRRSLVLWGVGLLAYAVMVAAGGLGLWRMR